MESVVVPLSPAAYAQLRKRAAQLGTPPETLSREILEEALRRDNPPRMTTRETLAAAGRLCPSPTRARAGGADISLDDVRADLRTTDGLSLSEIILEQRGPKD